MPKTIKNEETGEDEELYTPEEVDAEKEKVRTEAIDNYKKENPDKTEELETTVKERDEIKVELEKLKGKDMNFGNVRKIIDDLTKRLDEKDKFIEGQIKSGLQTAAVDTAIDEMAAGDEEMKKKIKFHFDTTLAAVKITTAEELKNKLNQSYQLAGGVPANAMPGGGAMGSGGAYPGKRKVSGSPLSPATKEVAKKVGITDEDIKKYDKQDFSPTT